MSRARTWDEGGEAGGGEIRFAGNFLRISTARTLEVGVVAAVVGVRGMEPRPSCWPEELAGWEAENLTRLLDRPAGNEYLSKGKI
jgi:hypothetical protein